MQILKCKKTPQSVRKMRPRSMHTVRFCHPEKTAVEDIGFLLELNTLAAAVEDTSCFLHHILCFASEVEQEVHSIPHAVLACKAPSLACVYFFHRLYNSSLG